MRYELLELEELRYLERMISTGATKGPTCWRYEAPPFDEVTPPREE